MTSFDFQDVLYFWFGAPGDSEYGSHRRAWFAKEPTFVRAVENRFAPLYQATVAGKAVAQRVLERACAFSSGEFSGNIRQDNEFLSEMAAFRARVG